MTTAAQTVIGAVNDIKRRTGTVALTTTATTLLAPSMNWMAKWVIWHR